MAIISNPPAPDKTILVAWYDWFYQVFRILFALQQSGTTANRPTINLWVGRTYFDTTLNAPVWVKSINPAVWIKADGTIV